MSIAISSNDASTTDPSLVASVTTIHAGCTPTVLLPSAPRDPWWHDRPVATFLTTLPVSSPLALTTVYTYPPECVDRWILSPLPACANVPARDDTAVGNRTVFSIDPAKDIVNDPSYRSCQRFSTATYSPGVCPDGHTVAELTASIYTKMAEPTSSVLATPLIMKTFWQASCCRSGMTIGPEYPTACISLIATPLSARALVTAVSGIGDVIATPAYEYTVPTQPNSTISNIVTVTSGIAIADPIVVGWQPDDLIQFPSDYASSLTQFIEKYPGWGLATPTEAPESQSTSNRLNTKAKVGIGVGAALCVLFFALGIVIFLLKRRRKRIAASKEQGASNDHQTEHWWHFGSLWKNEVSGDDIKHEMHVEDKQHELASKANQNELDSKALKSELDTVVAQIELDSKSVLNELDSRAVYVVPGPPAELAGVVPEKHIERKEVGVESSQSILMK